MSGWKRFFAAGTAALAVAAAAPLVAAGPAYAASGGQLTEICVNSLTGAVVGTNNSVACNLLNQVDYTVAASQNSAAWNLIGTRPTKVVGRRTSRGRTSTVASVLFPAKPAVIR